MKCRVSELHGNQNILGHAGQLKGPGGRCAYRDNWATVGTATVPSWVQSYPPTIPSPTYDSPPCSEFDAGFRPTAGRSDFGHNYTDHEADYDVPGLASGRPLLRNELRARSRVVCER